MYLFTCMHQTHCALDHSSTQESPCGRDQLGGWAATLCHRPRVNEVHAPRSLVTVESYIATTIIMGMGRAKSD